MTEPPPPSPPPVADTELLVLGAGPAGMAAALTAADLGVQVTVLDAAPAPGGQIFRQRSASGGPAPVGGLPARFRGVATHPRVRLSLSCEVWHAGRSGSGLPWVAVRARGAPARIGARAVVVATGATELALPFPGWDLPGVTTAGAAQALLKAERVTPGERVLVSGSGPFLLPVAAGLAAAGVRVAAVLEATRARSALRPAARLARYPARATEAAGYLATLARHRVPVRTGAAVVACAGDQAVSRAVEARVDPAWRPVPGSRRAHAVDAVCVSFGFVPRMELTRLFGCREVAHPDRPITAVWHDGRQATSVDGVFAAGEVTGVAGAVVAELEGHLAGIGAARHLGRIDAGRAAALAGPVRSGLRRARRFAGLLDRLYPLGPGWTGWAGEDTVVCRCEEVPLAAVRRAVADGARDARAVRSFSRCGMGYCQGRVCGPVVQGLVASLAGVPVWRAGDLHNRPLVVPVPLGELSRMDPDGPAAR